MSVHDEIFKLRQENQKLREAFVELEAKLAEARERNGRWRKIHLESTGNLVFRKGTKVRISGYPGEMEILEDVVIARPCDPCEDSPH